MPNYKLWTPTGSPPPPHSTLCSVLPSKGTPVFLLTQLQTVDSVIVPVRNYKHVPPPVPENLTPNFCPTGTLVFLST
jgi:hypothetical protein